MVVRRPLPCSFCLCKVSGCQMTSNRRVNCLKFSVCLQEYTCYTVCLQALTERYISLSLIYETNDLGVGWRLLPYRVRPFGDLRVFFSLKSYRGARLFHWPVI